MKRLFCVVALTLGFAAPQAWAEQFIEIGDFSAHYMILDTLSLDPQIADRYRIVRARNQSVLTLSILNTDGASVSARIEGTATNLLGNKRDLNFKAIQEGEAHYAIAPIQHTEEEIRFDLKVRTPDGAEHQVTLRQQLYLGQE